MRKITTCLLLALFALACQLLAVNDASAIPAFSREHNTECATCHTIFPELNEYGDVFLKNGFVWAKHAKDVPAARRADIKGEGDPVLVAQLKDVAAGGETSKDVTPVSTGSVPKSEPLWLAGLPQTVPLSLSASLNAAYDDKAEYDKVDLSTRAISLLAGGVFRDKLGFYLKYNLYAEGANSPSVSNTPLNSSPPYASDLEEFYLVWRNTFGTPINLKAGRFRPQLSLWKKSNKVGISDFATTSFRVGTSTFTADSTADAIEANGILLNRVFVAAGIVDRNGQDRNEGYGHLSVKLGGSDFHAREPEMDLDNESIMDYLSLVVGAYGYTGSNSGSTTSNERNNFYRAGIDLDLTVKSARVKLAWAKGDDENPDFASHARQVTDVYAAQGSYMVTKDMIAQFRYEYQEMNDGTVVKRYVPTVAFSPLEIQNTKVTLEYQHEKTQYASRNLTLLGIRVAF
jgi:hypothetical protein